MSENTKHTTVCVGLSDWQLQEVEREAYRRGAADVLVQVIRETAYNGKQYISLQFLEALTRRIERGEWPPKGEGDDADAKV
jgi:hypothetical protein